MIIFKRLIVWSILFGITLLQFTLYIPNFSCAISPASPVCAEQFSFTVIGGSIMTRELIYSIKELLRLISYLALDLGWSHDLADPSIYDDENLVDTFNAENVYKINHFSYCKKANSKKTYCVKNGKNGMDVISVLVRDVGIQLGKLSSLHTDSTITLGNSLVLSYHLALSSVRKFIKGDYSKTNSFLDTIFKFDPDNNSSNKTSILRFSKGVQVVYYLLQFNRVLLLLQVLEIIVSFVHLLFVLSFGAVLAFGRKHRVVPFLLKLTCSLTVSIALVSLFCTLVYLLLLKALEPSRNIDDSPTGWELLELNIGKGFVINCVRMIMQVLALPLTIIIGNHYSAQQSLHCESNPDSSTQTKDDV